METWNIRFATLEDVDALQALIKISAQGLNSEHYTSEQVQSILQYVYGVDTQLIRDQTYFVVQDGATIIGCGGWSRRKTLYGGDQLKADSPDNLLDPATDAARIRAFFVHPDWARKGVGSQLMHACEQAAREAGFHKLELVATLTGQFLYTRFGYVVVEDIDDVLPDNTVVRIRRMTKPLAS